MLLVERKCTFSWKFLERSKSSCPMGFSSVQMRFFFCLLFFLWDLCWLCGLWWHGPYFIFFGMKYFKFLITIMFNSFNSFNRVNYKRILQPSEIVDILKGTIIIICCVILSHVDMAMMYHLIKSQSVIKLYIFYNMLEVMLQIYNLCLEKM